MTSVAAAFAAAGLVTVGCGAGAPQAAASGRPGAPVQQTPEPAAAHAGGSDGAPLTELVDDAWVSDAAARTGIPRRALASYAGAALRLDAARPGCGVGWNTLAGIGAVESVHGRHGGSAIDADGTVRPGIVGVPLDGADGLMEIPDTDGGALDGDDRWDRAVGPMQFIPTTWDLRGRDGDRDGVVDPQQYDDAVLAAALHLCAHGGELTTDAGWNAAIAAYNRSDDYARSVAGWARDYAAAL